MLWTALDSGTAAVASHHPLQCMCHCTLYAGLCVWGERGKEGEGEVGGGKEETGLDNYIYKT